MDGALAETIGHWQDFTISISETCLHQMRLACNLAVVAICQAPVEFCVNIHLVTCG